MNKKKFSLSNWFSENKLYLLAFILPVLSMIVVYYFKDIFPFGDNMYLRSDCYHQYTPYLQILKDKLSNGDSLFYTWQIGSGMNFVALAGYYLSSPMNLLLILWPGNMADIVSFFIIVKMGLSGFAATYYLTKRFGQKNVSTVVFGMIYALSAYFAAFSWNIMWLDCMVLLPFIMLGLEKLVNEKKCKMYCIALGVAIFSNYYIGIMLCIYSVIYFIYLIFVVDINEGVSKIKARLIIFKNYVIYSLLAGGLAACVILPEYFNLLTTKSVDTTFPEKLEEYFSVLYMLFRSLICIPVADLKYPHDPNIYASVAMFILIPLFIICKNIRKKDRAGKTIIAIVMLLSFSLNIPNYIWHGMHFPNSLPCRQSFLYIFLLVTMAYEAFIHIREYSAKQILGTVAGATALILLFEELYKSTSFFNDLVIETSMTKIIYYSLGFIFIYAVLIFIYRKKPEYKSFLTYLMIVVCFCELTINMSCTSIASTSSRSAYYESNAAFSTLNEKAYKKADAEGVNFYRTEEVSHRTRNDGALFKYNSISTFSSVSSAAMQTYYTAIGMQTSFNAYSYYGHTPLTAALFSIKYEYTADTPSMPSTSSLVETANYLNGSGASTPLHLYENNYCLPLGFMINSSTMSNWNLESGNPFDAQNDFVKLASSSSKNIFHKLESTNIGTFTAAFAKDDTITDIPKTEPSTFDAYFYCSTSSETLNANITAPDGTTTTKSYPSTNQNYICHIGEIEAGSTVEVTAGDGSSLSTCYAYTFDKEAFINAYNDFNSQPFVVDSYSDTKITGKIKADNSGLMYTSIPFDEGWSIYIDGKKATPTKICGDALTGVYVSAGSHTITFKYCPKGFVLGIIITILSILIILAIIFKNQILNLIYKTNQPTVSGNNNAIKNKNN